MTSWIGSWPIVDPDIPARDGQWIRQKGLYTGTLGANSPVVRLFCFLAVEAFVLLVVLFMLSGVAGEDGAVAGLLLGFFTFTGSVVGGGIWAVRSSPGRVVGQYRHRVVMPADLDRQGHALLARARHAIGIVYSSEVHRRGLLDEVANDLILPRQLWEIASLLRTHSALRHEQSMAARGVVYTPELRAVLEPQRNALERSVQIVTDRVTKLEQYARQAVEADAALRAQDMLRHNDKYRDLLARTDDGQAMEHLAAQGNATEGTLRQSVRDAIETGQTLALPLPQWNPDLRAGHQGAR